MIIASASVSTYVAKNITLIFHHKVQSMPTLNYIAHP